MIGRNEPDTTYGIPDKQQEKPVCICCCCAGEIYNGETILVTQSGEVFCSPDCVADELTVMKVAGERDE